MSSSAEPPLVAAAPPQRARTTRTLVFVGLVGLCVAAAAWFVRGRNAASAAASAAAPAASAARIVSVTTAKVTREDVPVWLEGLGNVTPFFRVTVKPQVDGRLDTVFFTEGQQVKKGELLAQIDPRPFAIQLESAQATLARDKANLKNAQVNVVRDQALAQDNLITGQQLTDQQATAAQLEAQLQADQAQIDAARLNLNYARIASPIDGVTGVRLVDPGNLIRATDPTGLVVVSQLDPISVLFTLPEDQLPSVREAMVGQTLVVEALSRDGDHSLGQGQLAVIDNEINQATATVRLKAIFQNPDRRLWPNQFVKARLRLSTQKGVLVLPSAAVQHGPQGTFVYVVGADSTVQVRPVRTLASEAERAIIGSGVSAGELVVVSGQAQLRPGAKVAGKPQSADSAEPRASAAPAPPAASASASGSGSARHRP